MIKILIVEDEKNVQDFLENTFKTIGYSTFVTSTAKEAKDIFISQKPQVILLDLLLPDKNGLDVLKEFKEINQNNIIIIVSSKDDPETKKLAKKLGAAEFITKPFFRESIRKALAHNLHRLPVAKPQGRPKILIADDEEDVAITLHRYLQKHIE